MRELRTEILIVGGGLGGVAAALAAADAGRTVVLTEEYAWLGGQATSQAVPPDEHRWVEQFGVTRRYRAWRDGVRDHYRRHYPLTDAARRDPYLNPGAGFVSRLCHEPRVALAVLEQMLAPYRSAGRVTVLQPVRPVAATVDGDRVTSVTLAPAADPDASVHVRAAGEATSPGATSAGPDQGITVVADYVVDATELGDLLPLTGCEYVTGAESASDTGEPHAGEEARPLAMQAVSVCFAIDHVDGDHTIDRPADYGHWRSAQPACWPGPQLGWADPHPRTLAPAHRRFEPNPVQDPVDGLNLWQADGSINLWLYRRIAARRNFSDGFLASDITLVNWPMIDYLDAPVVEVPDAAEHLRRARQLSLSALYWLQTEAPRPDGGTGWRGLRLRGDVVGTDGLAMAPYVRESRRILARTRVVEQDLALDIRGDAGAVRYPDSVGVGMYRIDLHPSTGGDSYVDIAACPFQIPLGALIPRRLTNLLAGAKNVGTTHITNGCYRLHPVEWNVGEAAGLLAAHCLDVGESPAAIQAGGERLDAFLARIRATGIETAWPEVVGY